MNRDEWAVAREQLIAAHQVNAGLFWVNFVFFLFLRSSLQKALLQLIQPSWCFALTMKSRKRKPLSLRWRCWLIFVSKFEGKLWFVASQSRRLEPMVGEIGFCFWLSDPSRKVRQNLFGCVCQWESWCCDGAQRHRWTYHVAVSGFYVQVRQTKRFETVPRMKHLILFVRYAQERAHETIPKGFLIFLLPLSLLSERVAIIPRLLHAVCFAAAEFCASHSFAKSHFQISGRFFGLFWVSDDEFVGVYKVWRKVASPETSFSRCVRSRFDWNEGRWFVSLSCLVC